MIESAVVSIPRRYRAGDDLRRPKNYCNLEEKLREAILRPSGLCVLSSIPPNDSTLYDRCEVRPSETIGFVERITDDYVDVKLTQLGIDMLMERRLDDKAVEFGLLGNFYDGIVDRVIGGYLCQQVSDDQVDIWWKEHPSHRISLMRYIVTKIAKTYPRIESDVYRMIRDHIDAILNIWEKGNMLPCSVEVFKERYMFRLGCNFWGNFMTDEMEEKNHE